MTAYLSVHHPDDPAVPAFDFWAWRVQRRFMIDRLHALSLAESPSLSSRLGQCAYALERETFGAIDARILSDYLKPAAPASVRDAFLTLAERTRRLNCGITMHWHLPFVQPDWAAIPGDDVVFVGEVDGVALRARLPETATPVPPYAIVWINGDGSEEEPQPVGHARIGRHLTFAPAVWDWLFARRLTKLAFEGRLAWPAATVGPLVLPPLAEPARA